MPPRIVPFRIAISTATAQKPVDISNLLKQGKAWGGIIKSPRGYGERLAR